MQTQFTTFERRVLNNIEAIELLNDKPDRNFTDADIATLQQYSGWGGLTALFDPKKPYRALSERLSDAVGEKAFADLRESILSSYFTPDAISDIMWSLLVKLGFTGGTVVEPAAGSGSLIQACPDTLRANSRFVAIECCPTSAAVLKAKEPNIKVINQTYQSTCLPYLHYDCVIQNPPFLGTILQDEFDRKLRASEHNFFLQKAIKTVREGGFMCALVTRSFLDASDSTSREEIAKMAILKAAYRLPNNIFGHDNTNVVTDLLVFQCIKGGDTSANWIETDIYQNTVDGAVSINRYYLDNPDHIIGTPVVTTDRHQKLYIDIQPDSSRDLTDAIDTLSANLSPCYVDIRPDSLDQGDSDIEVTDEIALFNLGFDIHGEPVKRILDFEHEPQYERMSFNAAQVKRLKSLITLRTILLSLLDAEANDTDNTTCDHLRAELNAHYDKFVNRWGAINSRGNNFMRECASFGALLGLEANYDEGVSERVALKQGVEPVEASWDKAQIFKERLNAPVNEAPKVETATEALIASLKFKASVDLPYMAEISGIDESTLKAELAGAIFFNPVSSKYEYKDLYLSGNIAEKLQQAEERLPLDPSMQGNINALTEILPEALNAGHITVSFGAPWLPGHTLRDFIDHLLQINPAYTKTADSCYVGGRWVTNITNHMVDWTLCTTTYGNFRVNAIDIIQKLLNYSPLKVVDRNSNGKPIINKKETQLLQMNADKILSEWERWIFADEQRKNTIVNLYNTRFNCFVEPTFDGSILTDEDGYLPGQNRTIKAREHQLSVIMRSLMTRDLLVDAAVGSGKTLISLSSAVYQQLLSSTNGSNKTMVVVPNHLVSNWISEINKFFPSIADKVLIGTEYLVSKKQREAFLANIALGDWQIVLVTRSTFGLIPCSDEYSSGFIQSYIDEVEEQIEDTDDKLTLRELEKVKHALKNKMLAVMNRQKKDKTNFCFEKLGINQLIVDEIHETFKNLMYISKMNGVGGMGPAEGSQAAFDLFLKARYIQSKPNNRGVMGLSGTTITNSVVEAYSYLRYFFYEQAQQAGLTDLDTFVSIFAKPSTEYELSVTGTYKERTRLRSFTNLPELSALFRQFSVVITKDMLKAQCKAAGQPWYEPEIAGGKPQLIVCPQSPAQAAYMEEILYRAENLKNVSPEEDNLLKITSDAAKAALDMRFLDPTLPAEENSKINIASAITAYDYALSHDKKGVILVYIDLGVPGGSSGLNLYEEMKDKLIEYGVLPHHIVFAHEMNTLTRKRQIEAQLNAGEKRVFIASTSKGASGLNIQKRIFSIHNVDQSLSWTPAAIEQRLGRGLRSGSELLAESRVNGEPDHTIKVYNYATDRSLDSFRFGLLETKARFISMLKNAQKHQRIINEEDAGEASEDTFAAIKAAISGNPLILAAVQTEKKIKQLHAKRRAHQYDVMDAQAFVAKHAKYKENHETALALVALDIESAQINKDSYTFTSANGQLTATATTPEVLDERLALAEAAKQKTLDDYKAQYQATDAEMKALLASGVDSKNPAVAKLSNKLDMLKNAYMDEKSRRVRRPRCDLEMLFEKELHDAKQRGGSGIYGSKSEFGTYRGFRVSLSLDYRKGYIYLQGRKFSTSIAFDLSRGYRTAGIIEKLNELFEGVWSLEQRVNAAFEGIAKSFEICEKRQHAQFEHEDELTTLEELSEALHQALSTETDLDPAFAHLLPATAKETIIPTTLADIERTLPERISPPECYMTDDTPPATTHRPKPVQNIFEATQSLDELFNDEHDEFAKENDLIF